MKNFGSNCIQSTLTICVLFVLTACVSSPETEARLSNFRLNIEKNDTILKPILAKQFVNYAQKVANSLGARKVEFSNPVIGEPIYFNNLITQKSEVRYCLKADMKAERHPLAFLVMTPTGNNIFYDVYVSEGKEIGTWQFKLLSKVSTGRSQECFPQSPKPFIEAQKPLSQIGIKENNIANNPESSESKTASE
jgi:hypothetical protein